MKHPAVILMVGLPGSGKSTFVRSYLKENPGMQVVSTDDTIEDMARAAGKTYNDMWRDNITEAEKEFYKRIGLYVADNKSFIVDRTNLTVKTRARILNLIPRHYTKVAHVVEVDEHIRQQRLKSRIGKDIPSAVDINMLRNWSVPSVSEGFDIVQCTNTTVEAE